MGARIGLGARSSTDPGVGMGAGEGIGCTNRSRCRNQYRTGIQDRGRVWGWGKVWGTGHGRGGSQPHGAADARGALRRGALRQRQRGAASHSRAGRARHPAGGTGRGTGHPPATPQPDSTALSPSSSSSSPQVGDEPNAAYANILNHLGSIRYAGETPREREGSAWETKGRVQAGGTPRCCPPQGRQRPSPPSACRSCCPSAWTATTATMGP